MKMTPHFWKSEDGTETVEWAIIVGLIAVGAIAVIASIGHFVEKSFKNLVKFLTKADRK